MDPKKKIKEIRSLKDLESLLLKIPSKSGHDLPHSCTFIQKSILIIGLTMDHPCKKEMKACQVENLKRRPKQKLGLHKKKREELLPRKNSSKELKRCMPKASSTKDRMPFFIKPKYSCQHLTNAITCQPIWAF